MKIRKTPGWLFGDIALLFGSTRSASVVAASACTVWSLERKAFFQVPSKLYSRARWLVHASSCPYRVQVTHLSP